MKRICLNMIVKNEARVIERCLASVKPFIDTWVIADTGSTDGTQEVIRRVLQDIPGELFERPWVDFSHNRNEALQLAKDKAAYLLFIDADDVFVPDASFAMPSLTAPFYLVDRRDLHSFSVISPQVFLIDTSFPWMWKGVLHEAIHCPQMDRRGARLEQAHILYLRDGCRGRDPERGARDIALLLEAIDKEPANSHYLFYLAQSYQETGQWEEALAAYERRAACAGLEEERFYALFSAAKLREKLHAPFAQVVQAYREAYASRPTRIEPLFYLALYALKCDAPRTAYEALQKARGVSLPYDLYHVENWIWEWGLWLPLGDAAHRTGHFNEAKEAFRTFFSLPQVPLNVLTQVKLDLLQHPETARYIPA